jgi:DNA-binding transcriptional MerR regulator
MGNYSIKELEHLSGIKAHTIRIWEKRYSLIKPQRTTTNIRFYSDEDLKKIINVSLLNANGIKISKIAEMTHNQISDKILEITQKDNDSSIHINQLTLAMVDLDEEKFEKSLSGLFLRYNFEETMTEIVYPFLERIGLLWQTGNITPGQEHFIANLIRQKIIVAIDALPLPPSNRKKALLFLPEGELHEIGLLFYHYLARKAGYRTIYLGQTVPHADLKQVFAIHKPELLISCITTALPDGSLEGYLRKLADEFAGAKILVSGLQTQDQHLTSGPPGAVRLFKDVHELKTCLGSEE